MKSKKLIVCICSIIVVLTSILICNYFMSAQFGREYLEDITISSEDGKYTILIEEWGTIGGTGAEVYYLKDSFFGSKKVKIGITDAKDSCYPFRDGKYSIEWKENSAEITYFKGLHSETEGSEIWKTVILNFPE